MTSDADSDTPAAPMYGCDISGEPPTRLADLESIVVDLRFAESAISRLPGVDYEQDPDLCRALYDSAAIAYRRGFTGGRALLGKGASRTRVPEEILDCLDENHRAAHEKLIEHADTHIAHRVSDLEQVRVLLVLNNPDLGKSVQGVLSYGPRFVRQADDDLRRSAETASLIADSLDGYLNAFRAALLADARKRDPEELYANSRPLGPDILLPG